MATYITEATFNKYCRDVTRFLNQNRQLVGWVVHAGSVYKSQQTGDVQNLFQDGADLGSAEANLGAVTANEDWFYDSTLNVTYVFNDAADPDSLVMEAGEGHATFVADIFARASLLIDRELDKSVVTQVPLDRSGNYDELLLQITCYKVAELITSVAAPDLHEFYKNELTNIDGTGFVDRIIAGTLLFDFQNDATDSRGKIRKVAVAGGMELIALRGRAVGVKHDFIQLKIITGGAHGTATYTVKIKDSDGVPKNLAVRTAESLRVDFNPLAYGIEFKMLGDDGDTATTDDEWEIEVKGVQEALDNPTVKSHFAGRGGHFIH